jgi:hypothetical protein
MIDPPGAPRKETARIGATPAAPMKSTVKPNRIPSPSLLPSGGAIRTAPSPEVAKPLAPRLVESLSPRLCWVLLGLSALILLIQLWTYFS